MSKNSSARTLTAPASQAWGARNLAYCALLAALSIVFARLIIPMPNETTRFSIEAVPIFLAGLFFGPVAGGLVGFSADLVGCLFSGYGYNPIFSTNLGFELPEPHGDYTHADSRHTGNIWLRHAKRWHKFDASASAGVSLKPYGTAAQWKNDRGWKPTHSWQ